MEELPEQWLLQNSSTIKELVIHDASSLKSLPATMVRLTALEVLQISKANLYLCDRNGKLPAEIEEELKRLHATLPQITAVMGIADALMMKHPNASQWVEQFTQALETSEDVLGELEYRKLEDMVKNRDESGGSASSSKKRKRCTINDDTLKRLKEAITMLDRAAIGVEPLLQLANVLGIRDLSESRQFCTDLRRETTSFLPVKMIGREIEKERIISWLKRPTDGRLSSLGIVGMGGLGKTALVQFVYQEMCGSNHFDKTIWVCVSTNFFVEEITRKMLSELDDTNCSGKSFNALQVTLKEKILSKKVLLVLDDIWDDEKRSIWEQLVAPLRYVKEGSKIIFTTRMKSVADLLASVINTEHENLLLLGLREQEFRLIFNTYAFHGFDLENYRDLQAIGDQIIKMLRGNPLAAKVIGSLLNSCMDHRYWRRILNQGSIFNLEQAKDVVDVLKLSYYHLPTDLQVCFRYCSIFPEDHLFDKNDLIKMWVASGFIRKELCQKERPKDIGEDYFRHLLRKSFFEYSYVAKGERYVMPDLLHYLARNLSRGECCRIEHKYDILLSTVRHVSIHGSQIEKVSQLENLRSLVITTTTGETCTDPNFVIPSNVIKKSLHLLKINGFRISELTGEISHLVHLRYLSIDNLSLLMQPLRSLIPISYLYIEDCSGMEELPEQWLLQNSSTIKVLVIHDASSLKSLPATMVRLTALEVLQISKPNLLEELPELPASLRRLVTGDAHSLRSLPATMARLTALKNLSTLCFNNGNPES